MKKWALMFVLLVLAGCASTPPSRLYLLDSLSLAAEENRSSSRTRLGLGAVSLPDYLQRPQLTWRGEGGRLFLRSGERWGEPLDEGVRRVLADNLSQRLGAGRLLVLPANAPLEPTGRVQVQVQAFDLIGNEMVLTARWSLAVAGGEVHWRESRLRAALAENNALAQVAAMNQLLARLADEVAAAFDPALLKRGGE